MAKQSQWQKNRRKLKRGAGLRRRSQWKENQRRMREGRSLLKRGGKRVRPRGRK